MRSFTQIKALAAPLDRANVDTDAILSKQFMKSLRRTGYGEHLFDQWRYLDRGELGMDNSTRAVNPEFTLNEVKYVGAQILLGRENFGCGSSREHAAWALWDYGFRVVIAPSFGDIFYGNCFKNGLLPIVLSAGEVDDLFSLNEASESLVLTVDLGSQKIGLPNGEILFFEVNTERKHRLLLGLDEISMTLEKVDLIRAYEENRRVIEPWLFR